MPQKTKPDTRQLLIFARAPVPGRCKTRLMPRYGARGAAAIHRRLAGATLRTAGAVAAHTRLYCEPDTRHGFFSACRQRYAVTLQRQCRGDLGRKMGRAMRQALQTCTSVVVIGTDCVALQPTDIEAAFRALEAGSAIVLKPAQDGGYVLIGARTLPASALRHIDWSSGRELQQTLQRLRRLHLVVALLPTTWDVDVPRDVVRAGREGLL